MSDYKVYGNQTLQDVSIHIYGRVDVVMELAFINTISITEKLTAGQLLKLVDLPSNALVKKALDSRDIIPATAITEADFSAIQPEIGIGTMTIGTTFIVT